MKKFPLLLLTLCSAIWLQSCATNRIVVNADDGILRLGGDVSGHVYVYNNKTQAWELSPNKVTLPEGWYATRFHAP